MILFGPPGCGAEEIARELASRGLRIVNSDERSADIAGMTLADLAITRGQEARDNAVRAGALSALAELGDNADVVLLGSAALGNEPEDAAGSEVRARVDELRRSGVRTICLMAQPRVLARRAGLDAPRRVSLGAPRAMFLAMLTKRMPLYEEGNEVIDTDAGNWAEIAACLVDHTSPAK